MSKVSPDLAAFHSHFLALFTVRARLDPQFFFDLVHRWLIACLRSDGFKSPAGLPVVNFKVLILVYSCYGKKKKNQQRLSCVYLLQPKNR